MKICKQRIATFVKQTGRTAAPGRKRIALAGVPGLRGAAVPPVRPKQLPHRRVIWFRKGLDLLATVILFGCAI